MMWFLFKALFVYCLYVRNEWTSICLSICLYDFYVKRLLMPCTEQMPTIFLVSAPQIIDDGKYLCNNYLSEWNDYYMNSTCGGLILYLVIWPASLLSYWSLSFESSGFGQIQIHNHYVICRQVYPCSNVFFFVLLSFLGLSCAVG